MIAPGPAAESPLQHALIAFATALDHLIKIADDGGPDDLDDLQLLAFLQDLERLRNKIPVVDHALIAAALTRDLPASLCQRSMVRVLTSALRLSAGEAARRVRAAEQLGPRRSMAGAELPILRPELAAAQRDGEISPDQVAVIDRELRKVDGRGFDPTDVDQGERILTDAARALAPEQLRGVAARVVDAIDPDGTVPDDQHQQNRRFFSLRAAPDGSFRGDFRLTAEVGQKLKTLLNPLAAPQHTTLDPTADPTGQPAADPADDPVDGRQQRRVEPDERTREQRLHDALGQLCDRLLRSGGLPDAGGIPTTLVITIDAKDLTDRRGRGLFADGTPIPARQVIELADQTGIAWCVRGSTGTLLSYGRSKRIATPSQTLALIARDGGCSFPGCDTEPSWCERHHITSWVDGGPTDLSNLTLLCRYHHHNFHQRGWRCHITTDGIPAWTPPTWIDRHQRPIINHRIRLNSPTGLAPTAEPTIRAAEPAPP